MEVGIGFTLLGYSAGTSMAVQDYEQGSVASFIAALQGGVSFIGPVIGTALYTANMAFPYSICVVLIGIVCIANVKKSQRIVWRVVKERLLLGGAYGCRGRLDSFLFYSFL